MNIPITENYTYLGQIVQGNGRLKKHLEWNSNSSEAYTRTIKCLAKDSVINKVKNEAVLELYNKCVVPSTTLLRIMDI